MSNLEESLKRSRADGSGIAGAVIGDAVSLLAAVLLVNVAFVAVGPNLEELISLPELY